MTTRKDPRVPEVMPVKLRFAGADEFLRSFTENVSLGGLFIKTHVAVPVGARLDLTIELSPGKGLHTLAEVVWCREATADQAGGIGVRFVDVQPASQQWLDKAVKDYLSRTSSARPAVTLALEHVVTGDALTTRQEYIDVDYEHEDLIVGIDLGTSNSCACVIQDGQPTLIELEDAELAGGGGSTTLPSVVAYDDDGRITVGTRALQGLSRNTRRTIFGAKRFIGRVYDSPAVQNMLSRFPYRVVPGPQGRIAVEINGRPIALSTISAQVLKAIKSRCEEKLKRSVERAIITVPAYYNENQRNAVVNAGMLAGLKVERILNEPTAAAIAYGLTEATSGRILVYDLGGGTFDVSVMQVDAQSLQVLATGGDTFLGGEDFDSAIVQHVCAVVEKTSGKQLSQNHVALVLIKEAAEKAKRRLSASDTAMVTVRDAVLRDGSKTRIEVEISRRDVELLVEPLVTRSLKLCQRVLREANIPLVQLGDVLLVGGQTRMPYVRQRVSEFFKREPKSNLNPDEVVAMGAALLPHLARQRRMRFGDVLPMTIGMAKDGSFVPLIPRNTPVPHSMSFTLDVPLSQFASLALELWQGESEQLHQNEKLGAVSMTVVVPGARNPVPMEIQLDLSGDGLLSVRVKNLSTGEAQPALLNSGDAD